MDNEIAEKIAQQDKKLDAIYVSVEKTRKYFMWSLVITVVTIFIPLIGLAIAIPILMNTYTQSLGI